MLIGLIADTHIPEVAKELSRELIEALKGVDLILHAGDIYVPSVLDVLESIAPVLAASGDDDYGALLEDKRVKKKHILKQLILMEAASFLGFFITAQLLNWPYLYRTFGFPEPIVYVGLLLIGAVFSPLGFFLFPIEAAFSRRLEREADDFAINLLDSGEALADSLRRIAKDNLANLNPHPIYAWFYYSHPTLVERISRLTDIGPPRKPLREPLPEQHLKS